MIDNHRLTKEDDWIDPLNYPIRVIGVDPTVSDHPTDECGIVAMGSTYHRIPHKRHGYVFEDASLKGTPRVWARRAIEMAYKYKAIIVAEDNQGGEMVRLVIQAEIAEQQRKAIELGEEPKPNIHVKLVRSTKSKQVRAENVVLAYEQGRMHHTDVFGLLETQMTTWEPEVSTYSPDRIDALVIACTAFVIRQRGMAERVGPPRVPKDSKIPLPHRRLIAIGPSPDDPYRPRERLSYSR
jgi:phage terminase large subunit-like protein